MRLFICSILIFVISVDKTHKFVQGKKPSLEILFSEAITYYNPDYVSFYTATIKPRIPGPIIDVNMRIIRNHTNDENPYTGFNVYKKETKKHYRSLIQLNFNYCEVFGTKEKNAYGAWNVNLDGIIKPWIENIRKYANLPECPVMAGDYSIRDLRADKKVVPSFVNAGTYRIDLENYLKTEHGKLVTRNSSVHLIIKKK